MSTKAEKSELEVAERKVRDAEAAHQAALSRVASSQQEIAALCAQIKATDPDADELITLSDARSAARTRLEVLEERSLATAEALRQARAAHDAASIAADRQALAQRDGALRAEAEEILRAHDAYVERVVAALTQHRQNLEQANRLENELRKRDGSFDRVGFASGARTSVIAGASPADPSAALVALQATSVVLRRQREQAAMEEASRSPEAMARRAELERQNEERQRIAAGKVGRIPPSGLIAHDL